MRNLRCLTMFAVTLATVVPLVCIVPALTADPPDRAPADSPAKTAGAAQPDLEHEVRRLLNDLAGDTRAQRTEAERRLLELGPRVLPYLPAPELLPSNSVREAVRRIRLELERAAALESIKPSRVTFDEHLPLTAALDEITKQSGNLVIGRFLPDATQGQLTGIKADAVPFWRALDELTTRDKLRYEYAAALGGLKLRPRDAAGAPPEYPVAYAGAFRLEAAPAKRRSRSVAGAQDLPLAARGDLLRVTFFLRPEPRLRPLFLRIASKEVIVRSPDKVVLSPLTPEANVELALTEGAGQSRIQMDYVVPQSLELAAIDIQGKLQCTTAAGNEAIRFTELAKLGDGRELNIARRRGGVTVALGRVALSRGEGGRNKMEIKIAVSYDSGGPAFETHRSWMLHNEVYLEDATGKRWPLSGGSETTDQGPDGLGIIYRFTSLPDPLPDTFVYVAPTLIVDVPIEFQLKGVPVQTKP